MPKLPPVKSMAGLLIALCLAATALALPEPAQADVAPPETPPGSNIAPGAESTQVRMMAETVTLDVRGDSAFTTASFNMQNTGSADEKMEARFPLAFFNGSGDGFGNFPEISDIQVWVNGSQVETRRVETPNPNSSYANNPVPWAAFDVTFPPGTNVPIKVTYTAQGVAEGGFVVFKYILQTGAGWKDTIGSADLSVRLPYDASGMNVITTQIGFGETRRGYTMQGHELRWHYENLEPTQENDLEVALVRPAVWQRALQYQDAVTKDPKDGESWGMLSKAYKESIMLRRGLRDDPGGLELYDKSRDAYAKSVELLPNDPDWHFGFAELLWNHYYWGTYFTNPGDNAEMLQSIQELKKSLDIKPTNNQRALDLANWIMGSIPDAIQIGEDGKITYLALTATPLPPTPWPTPITPEAPTAAPTDTRAALPTGAPTATQAPEATQAAVLPPQEVQPGATGIAQATAANNASRKVPLPCIGSLLFPVFLALLPLIRKFIK